jgi:hypothetical protein
MHRQKKNQELVAGGGRDLQCAVMGDHPYLQYGLAGSDKSTKPSLPWNCHQAGSLGSKLKAAAGG